MELDFLMSVLVIIGIDIVLGGDNAIVIALASRNLPVQQRNTAIFIGTGLAILIRILLTIVAVYLLKIPFLQLVGGILLLFIAYNLLTDDGDDLSNIKAGATLGAAIRTIVFADIVMGFDNILAIAGAANGHIILVVLGLLVSVPIIVWGSKIILTLMERFSSLVYVGAGILAYTAGTMMLHEPRLADFFTKYPIVDYALPIGMVILVLLVGYTMNQIKMKKAHQ
ncbi:TerC family protein [Ectobacillus antri]|jgi:YjbE family integral membrane protein|uniref:TerC family protein n=1 Tax=Ectobacillus antri TaxID=2486280 RepID=A0ABT6H3Z9_9BACI|nr:TerC family protein [Ectobacillus antri]MDG4656649.1 TerC family protein [Ectobacillus antri]MDG5753988.1 TerC family protein [Ectobacillus antri]